jgi:hypothetical protein
VASAAALCAALLPGGQRRGDRGLPIVHGRFELIVGRDRRHLVCHLRDRAARVGRETDFYGAGPDPGRHPGVADAVRGAVGVIDRLERRGLLSRALNPRDRRSFVLELTSEGASAADHVREAFSALEERVLARAGERSVAGFLRVLEALDAETR